MASNLTQVPARNSRTGVVVEPRTTIEEAALRLRSRGAQTAQVFDRAGRRKGIVMAQDIFAANRLGAGREPVTRLVAWLQSTPPTRKPQLRLVDSTALVSAKTLCHPTMLVPGDAVHEPGETKTFDRRVG